MYTFKEMADAKNDPEIQLEPEGFEFKDFKSSICQSPLYRQS